jgi:WD40 repeat protein
LVTVDSRITVWSESETSSELGVDFRIIFPSEVILLHELYGSGNLMTQSRDGYLREYELDPDGDFGSLVNFGGDFGDQISCVCALQDGSLAIGRSYGNLGIWYKGSTGKWSVKKDLDGHRHDVWAILQLDDKSIISSCKDASMYIWDLENGTKTILHESEWYTGLGLFSYYGTVITMALLPDGRLVAGAIENEVSIWNLDSKHREIVISTTRGQIGVMTDGRVYSADMRSTVRIWDPTSGKCEHVMRMEHNSVCITPDGHMLVGDNNTMSVWY